ncbi:FAD-binding oxidoreductase [Chloroflexi bacterium TSY]|nr:FAD-binding oxidoreductase [Chloroflexi bacterium TSY]
MDSMYDVVVIGNGMIGSAASRYLSAAKLRVASIGPSEPVDWKGHTGPFASHYDQGRITRIIDPDSVWGLLAKRSIDAYAEIEEQSGVRFHGAAGCLRVSPDATAPHDTLMQAEEVGRELGATYTVEHTNERLHELFPLLAFPRGSTALWERGNAGYINPRQFVQAQLTLAAKQGATIIPASVTTLTKRSDHLAVTTTNGQILKAQTILISAGAYSSWLLERPLAYRRKAATIVLAELSAEEAHRLRATPSIIYRLDNHPLLASIYSPPPIQYPNGKIYLKIGGTLHTPHLVHSATEIRNWFHGDGDPVESEAVRDVLFNMIPTLAAKSVHSRPCVVAYTAHDHPYIDRVDERIYLATGGCGSSAKSANEIGRVGAMLVEREASWHYDVPAEVFRVCYESLTS